MYYLHEDSKTTLTHLVQKSPKVSQVVAQACNPSIWEAEVEKSKFQSQPEQFSKNSTPACIKILKKENRLGQ